MKALMSKKTQIETTDRLILLFLEQEHSPYIGESISQLQHALQCAYFATQSRADDEVVLAALCHDIGHFCVETTELNCMSSYGIKEHEKVGSTFLHRLGFSQRLCRLVEGHVQAKRYLVAKSDTYLAQLSPASKATLSLQGGMMSPTQCLRFERDPLFKETLNLRRWDESAKIQDLVVPSIESYATKIHHHLRSRSLSQTQCHPV